MRKSPWFVVSLCLCVGSVHAQATPASKPASAPTGAATMAKPAGAETPKTAAAVEKSPADAKLDKSGAAKPAAQPAAAAAIGKEDEWAVDAAHSQVGFVARHLGFTKVNGQFKKFTATAHGDPKSAKLTALEATVDTASIDTGIEKRDTHLKGEDFFNASKFPQLKLVAKSFKWTGNKFTATAELTIRDVTKPVTFKGELLGVHKVNFGQGEQLRAGYEASATINRKEFGLTWSVLTEGIAVVGDSVQIDLAAELSHAPPPTAASASTPDNAATAHK